MTPPKLSIIIPYYKGEEFIDRLLASLEKAFLSYQGGAMPIELLVLIDSPETDVEIVSKKVRGYDFQKSFVLISKNSRNIGVAATRNKGLEAAKGEYVYFIDQDDEVCDHFFTRLAEAFDRQYEFILLNGVVVYTNKNLHSHRLYYLQPSLTIKNLILDDIVRSPGQIVLKKNVIGKLSFPVPAQYAGADDKFFWILIFLYTPNVKTHYIHEPLYKAHIHEKNFSNTRAILLHSSLEAWNEIRKHHPTGTIDKYINANIGYFKFELRHEKKLSLAGWFQGAYEFGRYFFRLNKIIRYVRKRYLAEN
jgi:glycosyltransferase involved in cell wall biosynthesis